MKRALLLIAILILAMSLSGQYYGKNKIQPHKIDWKRIQTLHFDLYYPGFDDSFGKIAALCAEEAYYYLREDFKTPIKHRIPVIFYSTHQEFETTNIIPNLLSEGVGGFTESLHNRVTMPFSGSYTQMERTLIHELTHAYVNEISKDGVVAINTRSLPFWLSEGLPEFVSVNGKSVYNNMFIMDLVLNNDLINLSQVGGYYAYREGESFLTYIEEEYGREKVMDIFYSARISNPDHFAKKIFDLSFDQLQLRWENHLKRRYFALYNDYDVPYEVYERLTKSEKDGSSMNVAPSFAPDGINYAWFTNRYLTTALWIADRLEVEDATELYRSSVTGKVEEFHFQRNNVCWTPDGESVIFSANTSFGDRIYIQDVKSKAIKESISIDSIKVIYEVDISPDGKSLVFSGINDTYCDLYTYQFQTGEVRQITKDRYYDAAPRWSHDGRKIAFYSERVPAGKSRNRHVFDSCVSNIYYYDLLTKEFYQVTDSGNDCTNPVWNSDDSQIVYLTNDGNVSNLRSVDIQEGRVAEVTKVICGVLNFDLSKDDSDLIFSCFNQGAWNLYLAAEPLDSLTWDQHELPQKVELRDDFWEEFELERIQYYGKSDLSFKKPHPKRYIDPEIAERYDIEIDYGPDTTIVEYNRKIDRKPTQPNEPEIMPYKTKLKLDYMWGGLAYSSSGTYAMLDAWASDILGNHSLYTSLNVSGTMENSSILVQYLNLERRNDYGGGVFYLNDETIYRIYYNDLIPDDYYRKRIREEGVFGAFIHPINMFWRTEFQLYFLKQEIFRDWWNDYSGEWMEEYLKPEFQEAYNLKTKEEAWVMAPQISLVHDNSLYGSVGPVSGWRAYLTFRQGFSDKEPYSMVYTDLRSYKYFAKRYSWANRLLAGWLKGDNVTEYDLVGFYGIRGFDDDDVTGKYKLMASTELRFPLIDNLTLAFPLPIRLGGVRGSGFLDIGAVWDEKDEFRFSNNGKLVTPVMGIGFGPRLNMGYFVLKLDVAWNTDLSSISKPHYYFWLIEDF